MYPMYRMKQNITNGTEFSHNEDDKIKIIEAKTQIARTKCDYCGTEILAVWDEFNNGKWFPYLGMQAYRPNVYSYSPIIQIIRRNDGALGNIWPNKLMNVHARIHSKNWGLRCKQGSIKLLCNDCFAQTYNRIQIELEDGSICAISVVAELGETAESVMNDLELKGKILGKGGKY